MRKDFPCEIEFVPISNGLRIINTTTWNKHDFVISCRDGNGISQPAVVMRGALNQCEITGLDANKEYMVAVRRADLPGRLRYKSLFRECIIPQISPKYVVLVGASVGKSWNLPALPERLNTDGYIFGYRAKYGYDKTDVLENLVNSQFKPDSVIIKECAAYFPKESEPIRQKLPQWIELLASNNITPVLATCCPVTESNDRQNPGRQASVSEFNQFVRAYAVEKQIGLIDLEERLRGDDAMHYLRDDYAQSDGLHLLPAAYQALDAVVLRSLRNKNEKFSQYF